MHYRDRRRKSLCIPTVPSYCRLTLCSVSYYSIPIILRCGQPKGSFSYRTTYHVFHDGRELVVITNEDDAFQSRGVISRFLQEHGNEAFDLQDLRRFFNNKRIKREPKIY